MAGTLTTVATFHQPAQAELARNVLAEAGIQAVVADAEIVAMDWLLANAVGGIKVQVRSEDAERAAAVLDGALGADAGLASEDLDEDELARQALAADPDPDDDLDDDLDEDEEDPPAAEDVAAGPAAGDDRETYAGRLLLTSVVSLVVWPLVFYSLYLLLNAAFGSGPLSARGRRNLLVGAAVTLAVLLMAFVVLTPLGQALLIP